MEELSTFLMRLASLDMTVRRQAEKDAEQMPPENLPALATEMGKSDPVLSKAAGRVMEQLVHRHLAPPAGKDKPDPQKRKAVSDALLKIAGGPHGRMVRAHALHLLGYAGDANTEKRLTALENDKETGEDARMARERIRSVRY